MSNNDTRRLIEVLMPLEQASIISQNEKYVSCGGYISTFHVWPARRPLAACRAALLAALLPDPGDPLERTRLVETIGGKISTIQKESKDPDGNLIMEEKRVVEDGLLAWNADDCEEMQGLRSAIKEATGGRAPRVFDPFAGGGAIPLEAMWLGCDVAASDLNPVAWLILKGTLKYPHEYAGKSWPLPDFVKEWPDFLDDLETGGKRRRKRKRHFTDPFQRTLPNMLEMDLRWHIRAWGQWVLDRASADLTRYYPVVDDSPTLAYLWCRTARDIQSEGRIPVLSTFMLRRKRSKRVALLPIPDDNKKVVTFRLLKEEHLAAPEKRQRVIRDHPLLETWGITEDKLEAFLMKGTKSDAGIWSPFKGGRPDLLALTMDEIREQGRRGLMGTQMTAVCIESKVPGKKKTEKQYRLPTDEELRASLPDEEQMEEVFRDIPGGVIDESLPPQGSLGFRVQLYGFVNWRQLFTPRQLYAAGVFLKHTRSAIEAIRDKDPEHAEALAVYLTIAFSKMVDYLSTECRWRSDHEKVVGTIAGYKLPMIWDFAEANPITDGDRLYVAAVRAVSDAVGRFMRATSHAPALPNVQCVSSLKMELPEQDICFTDPPYYDAIPYADLMNFFRIWQKRVIGDFSAEFHEIFERPSPTWNAQENDGELIDDDARHGGDAEKSRQTYEDGMARAFERSLGVLKDDGRMVVVFANKEVDAWQSLIGALIRSGALVTASWPIQTEMENKVTQRRANLSTSVWIVCRKRDANATYGWDEHVLQQMRSALLNPRDELGGKNILRYFFDVGVRGADFLWAALGPALAVYSAYLYVKKTAGGMMTVRDFLDEVRKLVLHFALGALKGFEDLQENSGETTVELDAVTQYYLLHREAFSFDPVLAGVCILYANAVGKTDRELQMVWNVLQQGGKKKRKHHRGTFDVAVDGDDEPSDVLNAHTKADKYQLVPWQQRTENEHLGENRPNQPAPLVDKLHKLMLLLKQNRPGDVQAKYEAWGLAGDPAFPRLLQAVRELALRDHQADEQRLVESLASQLRMSRKIVQDNEVRETSLFSSPSGVTA